MAKIHISKELNLKIDRVLGFITIVAVFSLLFVLAHRALFDLDIWLHLKTGELIFKNKSVPSTDIFSFTLQGKPWADHSWLFQLLSYLVYSKWNIDGLIFLQSLSIILSFLVLFTLGTRLIKSYLPAGILLLITAYASASRFNIRPDIFSLLFFSLYLYLLRLDISNRRIWFLVPIQVLWVNFHGYFFLGPLLTFFFIIAEWSRRKLKFLPRPLKEEFALKDREFSRLKKLFLALILACLLNPQGLRGALYPAYVLQDMVLGKAKIFLEYIQELQPTFSRDMGASYYLLIILCFSLAALNLKKLKIVEVLLVLFFFLFSLSLRNIVFFIFICNIIIVSYIGGTLQKLSKGIATLHLFGERLFFVFKIAAAIIFMSWTVQGMNKTLNQNYYDFENGEFKSFLTGVEQKNYPKNGADFILNNNVAGNIFNDFNSGAYLIGRVYPKKKVFIDGRTELYGQEFFKEYRDMLQGDIFAFERLLAQYNINALFFSTALNPAPELISYLYKSPQWELVFFDEAAVIFLRNIPLNQELIKRYKFNAGNYTVPKMDLKPLRLRSVYPSPYIKRASLFNLLEEDDLSILECQEALRIMPNCAEAFHILGKVYLRKKLYPEAFQNLRSSLMFLPGKMDALVDLGNCFNQLKETKLAINLLKKAIRNNKRYAPAYYQLGCVYLGMNNEREAIRLLNKAISLKAQEPRYHLKLAEAWLEKNKSSKNNSGSAEAKKALAKALELNMRYQNEELKRELEDKLKEIGKL